MKKYRKQLQKCDKLRNFKKRTAVFIQFRFLKTQFEKKIEKLLNLILFLKKRHFVPPVCVHVDSVDSNAPAQSNKMFW